MEARIFCFFFFFFFGVAKLLLEDLREHLCDRGAGEPEARHRPRRHGRCRRQESFFPLFFVVFLSIEPRRSDATNLRSCRWSSR